MFKDRLIWKPTPLKRDEIEHGNFAKEIIETLFEVRNLDVCEINILCSGYRIIPSVGLMTIDAKGKNYDRYVLKFPYLDLIPLKLIDTFQARFGTFLNANGYELNPITYAIMSILHETGHIDYWKMILNNGLGGLYSHIDYYGNNLVSLTLGEKESELMDKGVNARYLLRGDEMFCDGFAMTYFRAVTNVLVEKGFPRELLTKKFLLEECVKDEYT